MLLHFGDERHFFLGFILVARLGQQYPTEQVVGAGNFRIALIARNREHLAEDGFGVVGPIGGRVGFSQREQGCHIFRVEGDGAE